MAFDTSMYSLIRPVPSMFDQMGEAQKLKQGEQNLAIGKQAQQLNSQAIEAGGLKLTEEKKAAAAQETINGLMKQAVSPDGSVDEEKLRQGFSAAGIYHLWPTVQEHMAKAREATERLKKIVNENNSSEDDVVGEAFAFSRDTGNSPQATQKIFNDLANSRRISPARVAQIQAQLQQATTPEAIKALGDAYIKGSEKQAKIERDRAGARDTDAQTAERTAAAEDKKNKAALQRASLQLYHAQDGPDYARRWQGLPPELQAHFDAPYQYDEKSRQRALEAAETSTEIVRETEAAKRDDTAAANAKATILDRQRARDATASHRRFLESHATDTAAKQAETRLWTEWNANDGRHKSDYDAALKRWSASHPDGTLGMSKEQIAADPIPLYTPREDYDTWTAKRLGTRAAAHPYAVGDTVTTKNGKFKVKSVDPDGTIHY